MMIECDTCVVRGPACSQCVVSVLLAAPVRAQTEDQIDLDGREQAAIAVLAQAGMVPPLRLATEPGPSAAKSA